MKRLTWWMVPLVAAVVFGLARTEAVSAAGGEGEKGKRAAKQRKARGERSSLRGEYAILASECDLTAEQKSQLREKVNAHKQAMAEWEKVHGQKAAELKAAMKKAREAGNKEEAKRLGRELKAASAERRRLHEQAMADIYALLTPEQKTKWAGFRLYRQAMRRYKKVGLSEEQTARIREMADKAAAGAADDAKAARKAMAALDETIRQGVLTAEQREKLPRPKEKKQPRARKAPEGRDRPDLSG